MFLGFWDEKFSPGVSVVAERKVLDLTREYLYLFVGIIDSKYGLGHWVHETFGVWGFGLTGYRVLGVLLQPL